MRLLKKIFGLRTPVNYNELVKAGAIILDVRTHSEFSSGHVHGAINIPVDQLATNLSRIPDKEKVLITVCASGVRSAAARRILLANGYTSVWNGGSWLNLQGKR